VPPHFPISHLTFAIFFHRPYKDHPIDFRYQAHVRGPEQDANNQFGLLGAISLVIFLWGSGMPGGSACPASQELRCSLRRVAPDGRQLFVSRS
jgi:hypothetical protein